MADSTQTTRFRFWLWLIALVGVIVPRRLRADWRQEWEAAPSAVSRPGAAGGDSTHQCDLVRSGALQRQRIEL
jgi:hypothetical protein